MAFIPKRHKEWKPERSHGPIMRRCHWCSQDKHRITKMLLVLDSPMRYYFCSDRCCSTWQEHRRNPKVVEWLRLGAGERNKILKNQVRHED